jgi:hypothetical protein
MHNGLAPLDAYRHKWAARLSIGSLLLKPPSKQTLPQQCRRPRSIRRCIGRCTCCQPPQARNPIRQATSRCWAALGTDWLQETSLLVRNSAGHSQTYPVACLHTGARLPVGIKRVADQTHACVAAVRVGADLAARALPAVRLALVNVCGSMSCMCGCDTALPLVCSEASIPEHVLLSGFSSNPVLHVHCKLPIVLLHRWSHGPRPPFSTHSLTSAMWRPGGNTHVSSMPDTATRAHTCRLQLLSLGTPRALNKAKAHTCGAVCPRVPRPGTVAAESGRGSCPRDLTHARVLAHALRVRLELAPRVGRRVVDADLQHQ